MSYETRRRWTGQGEAMCPLERRRRFGPIQPMEEGGDVVAGLLTRLLAKLLGSVK